VASRTGAMFNAFINAHPNMRDYADKIWTWADKYGIDKVVAASLFWRESFAEAKRRGKDPATIMSPTGKGVGIGQINPIHVGERTPWGHTITRADLNNAQFNIRWSMYYFSQQVAKYGNYNDAYSKGYNNGYTGAPLTSLLPKGYVPRGGLSPTDQGGLTAETAAQHRQPRLRSSTSGRRSISRGTSSSSVSTTPLSLRRTL
jgi:soluble lytic murein transglycosylase-like protein